MNIVATLHELYRTFMCNLSTQLSQPLFIPLLCTADVIALDKPCYKMLTSVNIYSARWVLYFCD